MTHTPLSVDASRGPAAERFAPRLYRPAPPVRDAVAWQRTLAMRLVATDLIALAAVIGASAFFVYDANANWFVVNAGPLHLMVDYAMVTVAVVAAWMVALAAFGTRRPRVIGAGTAEQKGVLRASAAVVFVMVLIAFVFDVDLSRGYTLTMAIAGTGALLVERALWRVWLSRRRAAGEYCQRVVIVGSRESADLLTSNLKPNSHAGYWIVGAVVVGGRDDDDDLASGLPVYGDPRDLEPALERAHADTVLIADGHGMSAERLRALSWSLEPGHRHLIVSPSLTDIAGPRVHSRPVAGLPLIHVETPRYEGLDRLVKRAFDIVGSLALMIALSPLLVPVALIVGLGTPGGVFFSHTRIGKDGRPFAMLKFRSMVKDADGMLAALLEKQGTSDVPLFKVENDPRITRIGRFLRTYSVDEIPQLINVLRGDMSLVGPRPQVEKEVAMYDHAASRRLYVRPGMTGLWQVSGRSRLTWEESLRLDLYYVENWSLFADLNILWRTARAVIASDGAV